MEWVLALTTIVVIFTIIIIGCSRIVIIWSEFLSRVGRAGQGSLPNEAPPSSRGLNLHHRRHRPTQRLLSSYRHHHYRQHHYHCISSLLYNGLGKTDQQPLLTLPSLQFPPSSSPLPLPMSASSSLSSSSWSSWPWCDDVCYGRE